MTTRPAATWQDMAAALVRLPGLSVTNPGLCEAVADLLGTTLRPEITAAVRAESSPARARLWAELLARLGAAGPVRPAGAAEAFLLFAYHPADVIAGLLTRLGAGRRPWSTLVEIYEAWYQLAIERRLPGVDPTTADLAAPHLARIRWMLLSMPYRDGGRQSIDRLDYIRVDESVGRAAMLARRARSDWLAVLDSIDDHPQLGGLINAEDDARDLVEPRIVNTAGTRDPAGDAMTKYVVSRLLLPRFAVEQVWRIIGRASPGPARWLAPAPAVPFLGAIGLCAWWVIGHQSWALTAAALLAAGGYILLTAAAAIAPPAAWPWLLRQPASAAVGLLALATLAPDWWQAGDTHPARAAGWAALGLSAGGVGYLYLEAAGHGVTRWRRAWRPLVVGVLGYAHAVLVSLIGLRFLLAVFAQKPYLTCLWQPTGCGAAATPGAPAWTALPQWLVVVLAASWSFAAGVFLQILWDDQPVTAPLAHVSWRRGR